MRIAIITTYPPGTGSLNEYAYHFVRTLAQKPEIHEICLLVDHLPKGQNYPAHTTIESTPVRIIPCWNFNSLVNPWTIIQAIRGCSPDMVLFNAQFATFGSSKAAAAFGLMTPEFVHKAGFLTIVLLHNIMETVNLNQAGFGGHPIKERLIRLFGTLATKSLLSVDLLAVTIPKYVEILESKYRAHNVLLAPHGAFEDTPMPEFKTTPGPLQIMTFGKFGTYKRVEILVDAFRILQAESGNAYELVIAGTDSPNAAGYLEGVRAGCKSGEAIRFTGYVAEEDVPRIFGEAAAVVFPYTSTTGSSGVLHQAGNYGKAVVLPNLGDLAELVSEEGYSGEFFEPEDPESLAAALRPILTDTNHRKQMGLRNYQAACGLPMADVVDWYIIHAQSLQESKKQIQLFPVNIRR